MQDRKALRKEPGVLREELHFQDKDITASVLHPVTDPTLISTSTKPPEIYRSFSMP